MEYLFLVFMNMIFLFNVARSVKGACLCLSSSPLFDLSFVLVAYGMDANGPN